MLNFLTKPPFWLFLLILFLPLGVAKHFVGEYSYINGFLVDYAVPAFYFSEIFVWGLIVSLWRQRGRMARPLAKRELILLAVAGGFLFLNFLVASNKVAWLYRVYRLGEAGLLLFWLPFLLKRQAVVRWGAVFLVAGALLAGVVGILQFVRQAPLFSYLPLGETQFQYYNPAIAKVAWRGETLVRAYSTFPHPNIFAGYLVLAGYLVFLWGDGFLRRHARLFLSFLALALLVAFSRVALVAFAFLLVSLARERQKTFGGKLSRRQVWWVLLFLPLGIVFLLSKDALVFSWEERKVLARLALNLFRRSPLAGVGFNQFSLFASFARFQPVHNVFLLFLSEGGVLGVLLVFVSLLRRARAQTFLARAGLAILLVLSLVDHWLVTSYQGLIIGCLTLSAIFAYNGKDGGKDLFSPSKTV